MAVSVSKADALLEMVKAYDDQQIKKANKIGQILSKSMQMDSKKQEYNEFIELDRDTKQCFPTKIRKVKKKEIDNNHKSKVEIILEDGVYEIEVTIKEISIRKKF